MGQPGDSVHRRVIAPSRAANDQPITFRPPMLLRALFALFGLVCAVAALYQLWLAAAAKEPVRLLGFVILSLPAWLAAAVWRKRVIVEADGLRSTTLFGTRLFAWPSIRSLDQTRSSFVIEAGGGRISAGWLADRERERLLRLTLEKARLMARGQKLRWGLIAQYVPRAQSVTFQPPPAKRESQEDRAQRDDAGK